MKMLILTLAIFSSLFTFSQNLRSQEEIKFFNKEFIKLINIERKKLNLDTLIESEELNTSSMGWSKECINSTKFDHSNIQKTKVNAECLDLGWVKHKCDKSVKRVVASFKSSDDHWSILMSKDYKYIGVGEYVKEGYMTVSDGKTTIREFGTHSVTTVHLH